MNFDNQKNIFQKNITFILFIITTLFSICSNNFISNASTYNINKNFSNSNFQEAYMQSLTTAIKNNKSLDTSKYKITFVTGTKKNNVVYKKCNSIKEIITLLENDEHEMKKNSKIAIISPSILNTNAAKTSASTKTVNKSYSRGWSPKYTLSADITYNTKTHKITSVKNRKFTLSGVTLCTGAEDKTYYTKYYDSKKKVRVRCEYTAVRYVMTPAGRIEISRKEAYQHFYYSVSKGVHDGSGGYQ